WRAAARVARAAAAEPAPARPPGGRLDPAPELRGDRAVAAQPRDDPPPRRAARPAPARAQPPAARRRLRPGLRRDRAGFPPDGAGARGDPPGANRTRALS